MLEYKQLKNITVLVADDNPMNRIVVKRILAKHDVQVTAVENGKDAIDILNDRTFDIILMDIQMPIMDGIEATKLIRGKLNLQIPIVALTGTSSQDQMDLCFSVGMNEYIEKPFNSKTLLQTLVKLIQYDLADVKYEDDTRTSTVNSDYDLSKLREISNGDEMFVKRMIGLFITSISSSLQSMEKALDEQDYATLSAIAHRIKPSINDLGITQISSEIREVEKLSLENPDSKLIPQLLIKVTRVLKSVIDQLEKEVN